MCNIERMVAVLVGLGVLVACSPKPAAQKNKTTDLPVACGAIAPVLFHCKPIAHSVQDVNKILAVMSEQLQTASTAEQLNKCQDAVVFWQAACGVTQ